MQNQKHGGIFSQIVKYFSSRRKIAFFPRIVAENLRFPFELFSVEQRERQGKNLAVTHNVKPGRSRDRLLERLHENENLLLNAHNLLVSDIEADRPITVAGEWLLDNFYVIEQQIRMAQLHLPKGYSRELLHLSNTNSAGLPRVYDIAQAAISYGDGRVDAERLGDLVSAYQSVKELNLGELWAVPIMLRLALVENICVITTSIVADRKNRLDANDWADRMIQTISDDPKSLILVVADLARSIPTLTCSFVSELSRRLRSMEPVLSLPLNWIEQQLSESNQTIEQLVHAENQKQAANQISMGNSIGSLRTLDATNWREFVEKMSLVDQTLLQDPAEVYAEMDFATRDRYRHIVERTAKSCSFSEKEVAQNAIRLAEKSTEVHGNGDRRSHVGYYLIDQGLETLKKTVHVRRSLYERAVQLCRSHSLILYLGTILFLTIFLSFLLGMKFYATGLHFALLGIAIPFLVLGTSYLAVALTNWLVGLCVKPKLLPRMDFSQGIPKQSRTLVVVPTMLTDEENVESLFRDMEVRFLANRDPHLHFALLTDFCDSKHETEPSNVHLLQLARKKTNALNKKYRGEEGDIFFLFHRPRRWNPGEGVWMGHERKRGKLAELNDFLRNGKTDSFSLIVGETESLTNVKYVITLDTDTSLARDSARQFVGAMAHPLNRPLFDSTNRIVSGYAILQPRVMASLVNAGRSWYTCLYAGLVGIDPYTRATSDVYQDIFGEGSFIGKGIYDVEAFEKALSGQLPDNTILSHDLLEGCYARSGLLSDVHLYEESPSRYASDVSRRYRWIRGDWQIARWVFSKTPVSGIKTESKQLSILSRWKILDNLRRSTTAVALMLILLLGWFCTSAPLFWTLVIAGILFIPSLVGLLVDFFQKPPEMTRKQHWGLAIRSLSNQLAQSIFSLCMLPFEAFYSMDAMIRTLWRMTVSHKHLLQWKTSAEADKQDRNNLSSSFRRMWFAPLAALLLFVMFAILKPMALIFTGPLLTLWLISPWIAWSISQVPVQGESSLTTDQVIMLRKIARKTWAFFDDFVGAGDHWLPPDNYQEHPVKRIAHRTSPTNMGLSLLANLTAYDFGIISLGRFLDRTSKALQTMDSLERYRGHFFNWYDTLTSKPLPPRYVSSVDSGNLVGYVLTLRAGLREIADRPLSGQLVFEGLNDTLRVAEDGWLRMSQNKAVMPFYKLRQDMDAAQFFAPQRLSDIRHHLNILSDSSAALNAEIKALDKFSLESFGVWLDAFNRQCKDALEDLTQLVPWLDNPYFHEVAALSKIDVLNDMMTLRQLADFDLSVIPSDKPEQQKLRSLVQTGIQAARLRLEHIDTLVDQCTLFSQIEYDFLNDKNRHLLSIGYNVDDGRRDAGYYDLLASESCLATFVGIAQGVLPQENWFALGRILTTVSKRPVLLSWSGSMFEYLMPRLVMPAYENTLLNETAKAVVDWQVEYATERNVPWGISESGYYTFDSHLNYQYRAFGAPGLGLSRGLASDLVIAPYATVMALMVAPKKSVQNLERLSEAGFEGQYGFYEAADYTTSRLPRGRSHEIVRSFMAHHQGMSLLALAYLLLDRPMQRRFMSDPSLQATLLLLQEKIPETTVSYTHTTAHPYLKKTDQMQETPMRVFTDPNTPHPEVQLLSNGSYHVMVTNAGGGYSRWRDLAVTRWREDCTRDHWGTFCYLRDKTDGQFWSTAFQPTLKNVQNQEIVFSEGRAEFTSHHRQYDTRLEIVVSPEDDIELRRLRITNRAGESRTIELTWYTEAVLAPAISDTLHPAFSNLFVQTEFLPNQNAILCTRRLRSKEEKCPFLLNTINVHGLEQGTEVSAVSYETDRQKFIGRGGSLANPLALKESNELSGSTGAVLDPVLALRVSITLGPDQSAIIDMGIGIAETRESAIGLLGKYRDSYVTDRIFNMAWTHGQALLRQLNASDVEAQHFNVLAGSILYANSSLRAPENVLSKNRRGQSGLWGYTISGDLPIVLLKIEDQNNIDLVRQMLKAHEYWRQKGLSVDLVIWNEDQIGYRQLLNDQIMDLINSGSEANLTDRPGGIFLRASDRIAEEDRTLIKTVARVIVSDTRGTLAEQVKGFRMKRTTVPAFKATRPDASDPITAEPLPRPDLRFYNGLGGFTPDGREYVITTNTNHRTPAPWVNVMANPHFGTVVSESGTAYTWSENAHEFLLTPWANDPVSDDSNGEAFYIRDEETGRFWSPMPCPCGNGTPYITRHGFGYSIFEHSQNGIRSETTIYVSMDAPIKFVSIKIHNESGKTRRLSVAGFVEWVLGDIRSKTNMHIVTEIDTGTGALFARNFYNTEFTDRTAFFTVDDSSRTVSSDRSEFIGRNGSLSHPAIMKRQKLSGKVGAGLDSSAAMMVHFELADAQERVITFKLGVGADIDDARNIVNRFQDREAAQNALDGVWHHWTSTLGLVNVDTPDPAINMLVNGWLLYQTMSCRMWGRSATYQSGGAFGFRDQLQDSMALIHARPELIREQLLLCAAHQFVEGDVLHWWHPPLERGVRTHCSDDYLWLPLATCRYVRATGDHGVLDENVHYIEGRPLREGEDSYYDLPLKSKECDNLYQHCVRAILKGLNYGVHGLPLIGSGDWNDGMDMVGKDGKGESVWLGFFLYEVLHCFAEIARLRNDEPFALRCLDEAETLRHNLELHAWDGDWYRRAYFDDGTPLGSKDNHECQIDSIAQSWSVLSGAAQTDCSVKAMKSLYDRLVNHDAGLIQLFDPPFDRSDMNPGYIKGYLPGVRENGGQYTHGAIWAVMAFAKLGDTQKTWELLSLINPINHANKPEKVDIYKVEPYVMAADVYASPAHIGRGGWTWYTGSAAWMYRLITESFLGLRKEKNCLSFHPCFPDHWDFFKIHYRYYETVYHMTISRANDKIPSITLDGQKLEQTELTLVNDHGEHTVEVKIGVPPLDNHTIIRYKKYR